MPVRKAIFLDKDGTLVDDIPYNTDPDLITLTNGAARALQLLGSYGFRFIIISNQSGVARGFFSEEALRRVEAKVAALLKDHGVSLSGFYYCPHHPDGSVPSYAVPCHCRKPMPGLLQQAAREHRLTLEASWMIGDILDDVEAGNRAGCRTVLLDNGHETEWHPGPYRIPRFIASDLLQAAHLIHASIKVKT